MSDDTNDDYLNYVSQLRKTLEVASADPVEQCEIMGSYNAPWELTTDARDFIGSVVSLQRGQLNAATVDRLNQFKHLLQDLPDAAVIPEGENMTTFTAVLLHSSTLRGFRSGSPQVSYCPSCRTLSQNGDRAFFPVAGPLWPDNRANEPGWRER